MKIINRFNALKRVLRLTLFILTLIVSLTFISDVEYENNDVNSASSTEIIKVYAEAVNKSSTGEAYPEVKNGVCSKQVSVYIKLTKTSSKSITVKYKTFDASASSSAKTNAGQVDYVGITEETSIIFNANDTVRTISITVSAEKFPVYYNKNNKTCGWSGRYFYFQITGVEGENVEVDTTRNEVKCHIAYDYIYEGTTKNNKKTLKLLNGDISTVSTGTIYCDNCSSSGDTYTMKTVTCIDSEHKDHVVKEGLGYAYVTASGRVFDLSMYQNDIYYYLYTGSTLAADIHLDGYLGRLNWFTYKPDDWDDIDFGKAGGKGCLTDWSYKDRDYEGSTNHFSSKKTSDISPAPKSYEYTSGHQWYILENLNTTATIKIYTSKGSGSRGIRNMDIKYATIDTMKPYITSYWCDREISLTSGKVQMMVRFNQPCTITNSSKVPVLKCNVNNQYGGQGVLDFTYVDGDGSDTFVFEADLKTCGITKMIESLIPDKMTNTEYIADCSGNFNTLGTVSSINGSVDFSTGIPKGQQLSDFTKYDSNNCSNLSLDPRVPKILTGDGTYTVETKIKNSFTVNFTLENFDDASGTVYCCWSNDCTKTDDIVREGEYFKVANTSKNYYSLTNNSLTGVRFLWIKAVSRLGLVDAKIIGPYKFDNVAETAQNLTFNECKQDVTPFVYSSNMGAGAIPSQCKYVTFEIDYSDRFYTSSDLAQYDVVWSTDEIWNEKSIININSGKDPNSHVWNTGKTVSDHAFDYLKAEEVKEIEHDLKFGIYSVMDTDNGVSTKYQKSTFYASTSSAYLKKVKYASWIFYDTVGIEKGDNRKCYIGVKLVDSLGNTKTEPNYDYINKLCYFESRNIKSGTWAFNSNNAGSTKKALDDNDNLIYTTTSDFAFTADKGVESNIQISVFIQKGSGEELEYQLQDDGKFLDETKKECEYFNITYNNLDMFSFVPKTGSTETLAGFYNIYILFKPSGFEDEWAYSREFEFYYVNKDSSKTLTFTDSTNNLSKMVNYKTLTNKVYSINIKANYYYKDSLNYIQHEQYSTGSPLSFSDKTACENYLRFMEYQDLTLVVLSQSTAGSLNNGSSGMIKAEGHTDYLASENQTWIKYKRSTWTSETASDSNWVYYLYDAEKPCTSIEIGKLDNVLTGAINLVVQQIMNTWGGETYLNSDFGLTKYGAPKLNEAAIKDTAITVSTTKSGAAIVNNLTYTGDSGIYSNEVRYNNESIRLASTYELEFSDKTILYYAKYEGKEIPWANYQKIYSNGEMLLKKLITNQGAYRFIEIDENGAQSCIVYIDNSAPTMKFTYEQKDKNGDIVVKSETTDSTQDFYSFYGTKCTLGVMDNEIDELSHVTIYNAKTGFVYKVFTRKELEAKKGEIVLENNRYNVEVYDRSGNYYIVSIMVNSTELQCSVNEKKNQYIVFNIENRVKSDILTYLVRYNTETIPVASSFEESRRFDQAGIYQFDVVDYYGNEYHATYEFKREIPELKWNYCDENSKWVNYDSTKIQDMYVTETGSQVYTVVTSKKIGFVYEGSFDLIVVNNDNPEIIYSAVSSGMSGTYRFDEEQDFSFTVSYAKYPEVYATYYVKYDTKAPEIKPTYKEYIINNSEEYDVARQASETIGMKQNDIIIPNTIGYTVNNSYDKSIALNSKCNARSVRISFFDDNEIYQISIKLGNETLVETTEIEEYYEFEQYGVYTITAVDRLNNRSIFRFENSPESEYAYSVDDTACVTPISNSEYFDDNNDYTKVEYGNTSAIFKVPNVSNISLLINNDDQRLFFRYNYDGTKLTKMNYVCSYCYDDKQLDEDGNVIAEYTISYEEAVDKEVFYLAMITGTKKENTLDGTVRYNQWYQIATVEDDGVAIYVKFDDKQVLYIRVDASNFETDNFDTQIKISQTDLSEPFFARVGLSKKKSDINLENEDGKIETNHIGESVYVNGAIKVKLSDIDTQEITAIRASYSTDGKFKEFTTIYEKGEFTPYVLEYEGFYRIIIDNIYGNQTIYNIALSNSCLVVLEMVYYDGSSNTYTSTYPYDNYYSNDRAKIDVYSQGILCDVTKDGVQITPTMVKEDTHLGIILEGNGSYVVLIQDQFGNHYTKYIDIELKTLTISSDLLTGFNEKALMRNDNYTNRKISVNYDELQMTDFEYIYVFKNDEINNAVYDMLAENKIEFDQSKLVECIGNDGDGVYKVVFRDKFGNAASTDVNYRETTTMTIERQSRTELAPIQYDLEKALTDGAYSNNIVSILSNSSCYTFIVNGNQSKIPYTFEFANNTLTEGTRDFDAYYLDEYGFEYSFKVHLLRTTIDFDPINFSVVTINEKLYTQDYLSLTFKDEYTCSYTLDGGESVNYPSGILVNDDGSYLFTLTDVAGNVAYYAVNKDTIVEYAFVGNNTATQYVSSSVVNNESISFTAKNFDSAKIAKVFLNGEEQVNYDTKQIKKDGKWEFLLTDDVGNQAVYTLYIVTHSINQFDYTCPKNYQISDVRYDSGNGQNVDYMNQVVDYSSFSFNEDGKYKVTIQSTITNEITKFEFEISNVPPQAVLEGVEDGSSTISNVTLKGTVKGDVIYIYKDGKLSQTFEVSEDGQSPEIEEKGTYKFVIKNLAGNTSEFTFTKKYVANTAGSVLIMVVVIALGISLFIGVVYRNKAKVDK